MDLGFDYGDLTSKVVVSRFSLIRGFGDAVFKNFDAKLAEYLLALVLVDFHLFTFTWLGIRLRRFPAVKDYRKPRFYRSTGPKRALGPALRGTSKSDRHFNPQICNASVHVDLIPTLYPMILISGNSKTIIH